MANEPGEVDTVEQMMPAIAERFKSEGKYRVTNAELSRAVSESHESGFHFSGCAIGIAMRKLGFISWRARDTRGWYIDKARYIASAKDTTRGHSRKHEMTNEKRLERIEKLLTKACRLMEQLSPMGED